jgi:hypothetical protein
MATIANTRALLTELLKIVYEPSINSAVRDSTFFLKAFTAKKYDGKGKQYTFAAHLQFNQMVAARSADDYLESAQQEKVANGTITPKYLHIPFEISHDLMVASKGDEHAFADGMSLVQETSRRTFRRDMNRMAVGDGRGILATVTANLGSADGPLTVTVDTTKFLQDGMIVEVWNGAATTNVTRRNNYAGNEYIKILTVLSSTTASIDTWNSSTGVVGGTNVPALTSADVLIRKGTAYVNTTRFSNEPDGLRLMADDGTLDPSGGYLGISASTFSNWKGIVRDAGGVSVSPGLVSAVGMLYRRWSNTMFDTIWCHGNQGNGLIYGDEGSYKDKRFVDAEVNRLGTDEEDIIVNVRGKKVRIRQDDDLSETELNFFDSKVIRYVELYGIELLEQADGQYLTPWRDSTGQRYAQVGFWGWAGNWGCVMRNAIARIYNVGAPASIPSTW